MARQVHARGGRGTGNAGADAARSRNRTGYVSAILESRLEARSRVERGPLTRLLELPGIGHAPALMDPAQVEAVCAFLLEP